MKPDIHPDYHPVVFRDRSADFAFLTRSTATSDRTIEWEDGKTYPVIDVVTVVIILSAMSHLQAPNPALLIVALGMLSIAVTDSVFTYLAALNEYQASNASDAGYVAMANAVDLDKLLGNR